MTPESEPSAHPEAKLNRWKLCIAWAVVGIPLGWGVVKSVEKSLPLFDGKARASAQPAAAPRP